MSEKGGARLADAAGEQVAVDDGAGVEGALQRLVDAHAEQGQGLGVVEEQLVETLEPGDGQAGGLGHRLGAVFGRRQLALQLVETGDVAFHEVAIQAVAVEDVACQAVEQYQIRARGDGQVQIRLLGGGGGAGIDHHPLLVRVGGLGGFQPAEQHRVGPGGVGADDHHQLGLVDVLVAGRHRVLAEGMLVGGHGGGHAQPGVGVDIGRADKALHQLVGHIVVFGQHLARAVEGDGAGAVAFDKLAEAAGDMVDGPGPVHLFAVYPRVEQAVGQALAFAQRHAFHAQRAEVGGMAGITAGNALAVDLNAAANAAIGAGGMDTGCHDGPADGQ